MGTVNSSQDTRERAKRLAEQIGSNHLSIDIDEAVSANMAIFAQACDMMPKFKVHGGSEPENLALQNVQVWTCVLARVIWKLVYEDSLSPLTYFFLYLSLFLPLLA